LLALEEVSMNLVAVLWVGDEMGVAVAGRKGHGGNHDEQEFDKILFHETIDVGLSIQWQAGVN